MKKVLITIAAMIAVLTAALLIMNFVLPKAAMESGDEDSLYQYSYEASKKGLTVHITGEHAQDCIWVAEAKDETIHITEKKQKPAQADFLIEPAEEGEATAVFSLQKETDGLVERFYEITVQLYVNDEKEVQITSNYHRELTGLTGQDGDGFSYRVSAQADGTIFAAVTDQNGGEWLAEVDGGAVSVTKEESEQTQFFLISYENLGQSTVYLCNEATGKAVELYLTTDNLARVRLVRDQITDHRYAQQGAASEFKRFFGEAILPEEAVCNETSVTEWLSRADQVTKYAVGCKQFTFEGKDWTLYLSDAAKPEDFTASCVGSNLGQSGVSAGSISGNAYVFEGGGASSWENGNGRSYMLRSGNTTLEELVSVTEKVMKAADNG